MSSLFSQTKILYNLPLPEITFIFCPLSQQLFVLYVTKYHLVLEIARNYLVHSCYGKYP
jgi:hypothetical protein